MIIDDEKTTHFNDFFRRHDMIITSRTNVRGSPSDDEDDEMSIFRYAHLFTSRSLYIKLLLKKNLLLN